MSGVNRLPSLFGQTLLKSEADYKKEINRRLDRIQHDNRDAIRRRIASKHIFSHELLTKRYQWFTIDKSYRDACRTIWNKQTTETVRTSHLFLPSIYTPDNPTPLSTSRTDSNSYNREQDESPALMDERIKENFLRNQPVMIEILRAPHSSQTLKNKHEMELRKKSAQKRHTDIQTTATNDKRYRQLVFSLQET